MTLLVDYRESHVKDELDKLNIPYEVKNLDIGDYQIIYRDAVIGIWERKTYSDLAASVSDSRYREQKHRITTSDAIYKGYIIEGNCPDPSKSYYSLHPGAIESVKIGLCCRDGFSILHSNGTRHTAIILQKLVKKLPEYLDEDKTTGSLTKKYHDALVMSSVSSVKKDNITPEICYQSQLCQLPHVSVSTALAISSRWCNMGVLTSAIMANRETTKIEIADLKVSGRRLGESVSAKIVDFLVPEPKKVVIKKKPS